MVNIDVLGIITTIEDTFFITSPVGGINRDGDGTNGGNSFKESVLIINFNIGITLVDDFRGLLLRVELASTGNTEVSRITVLVFRSETI